MEIHEAARATSRVVAGIEDITLRERGDPEHHRRPPTLITNRRVDVFGLNTSPLAGVTGVLTSRTCATGSSGNPGNVSLRVEDTDSPEQLKVVRAASCSCRSDRDDAARGVQRSVESEIVTITSGGRSEPVDSSSRHSTSYQGVVIAQFGTRPAS